MLKEIALNIEKRFGVSNGTLFFMLSALLVKAIGAIYKIPLYNLLGSGGVGLYQMVFPLYALLLTLSSGGIPSGMTKLISCGYNGEVVLKKSLKIFLPAGIIFSLLLFIFGKNIAVAQGDYLAGRLYLAISPAIVLVCLIGCFRGYFQGESNFFPTALSQLVEQIVKAISGIIALLFVNGSYEIKAFWACCAVTFSEIIAFVFLLVKFVKNKKIKSGEDEVVDLKNLDYKQLLSVILPLTLSSLCLPFASFIQSFIAVNLLKKVYFADATAVYGVYTGGVEVMIGLPVAVLHSLSLGFLPKIKSELDQKRSLIVVFLLSVACAIGVCLFAPFASKLLFGSANKYFDLLVKLLRYASINIVLHSTLHATAFIMLSLNEQKKSFVFLGVGAILKVVLDFVLIANPKISVFGMIISDAGCYFVALILNLIYIKYINKNKTMGSVDENYFNRLGRRRKFSFRKSACKN